LRRTIGADEDIVDQHPERDDPGSYRQRRWQVPSL
jgi:hypothetical protein